MNDAPTARIFFCEILAGDRLKLAAQSNLDAAAGGGARDLRFPDAPFRSIMLRLFPVSEDRQTTRMVPGAPIDPSTGRRPSRRMTVVVQTGKIYWYENGELKSTTAEYHPPTLARPSEGRLAKIHKIAPLRDLIPSNPTGRLFLVLVQTPDGKVFPNYLDEDSVRSGASSSSVLTSVLDCINRVDAAAVVVKRPSARVIGYVDFAPQRGRRTVSYCHEQ
jgi:hypothetical protein